MTIRERCPDCAGRRTITLIVPERRSYTVSTSPSGFPAWACDGGKPIRHTYETGRYVERRELCPTCKGRGAIVPASA